MSDIPRAREILKSILDDLGGPGFVYVDMAGVYVDMARSELRDKLQDALGLMGRHYLKPPAPRRRRPLTEDQKIAIRAEIAANPTVALDSIARRYDVANGRVSEALRGR